MARVLRPGGLLLVMDFSLPEFAPLREFYRLYLHKVLPRFAAAITGNKEAYEYLGSSIESFPRGRGNAGTRGAQRIFPFPRAISLLRSCQHLHGSKENLQINILAILASCPTADTEDVSGASVRIERNEISGACPKKALSGKEVFHLKGFLLTDSEVVQGDINKRRLGMVRIDRDRAKNETVLCSSRLAVEEDVVVFRVVKAKICVFVKSPVFLADRIQLGDVFLDVSWRIPIAPLELVFFGIEIFLLARNRGAFAKLEPAVDSIDRRERGRENRADEEGRTPAQLKDSAAKYPACSRRNSRGNNPSFPSA